MRLIYANIEASPQSSSSSSRQLESLQQAFISILKVGNNMIAEDMVQLKEFIAEEWGPFPNQAGPLRCEWSAPTLQK